MHGSRRHFLRAAGVSLALPCLDVFTPTRALANTVQARRRMVCICAPLGFYPPNFLPDKAGNDYELSTHLELLSDYRQDFTVISGLMHLALRTDSTRLVTIMLQGSTNAPPIPGVSLGHHDLSHHGKDPQKLEQLKIVEVETMKTIRDLLAKLKQSEEGDSNLLDQTTVFLGSNLGDASSHSVKNLPVLVAGGGFRHGQHLAFDPDNPPPLCNLFVSLLQRLDIETDRFGNSTGTLNGLDNG